MSGCFGVGSLRTAQPRAATPGEPWRAGPFGRSAPTRSTPSAIRLSPGHPRRPTAFIATIGPEVETHGETTLADTVTDLQTAFAGSQSVSLEDIEQNRFDSPKEDDIIYLVAHGDDPGHSAVARPDLGGKSAQQIATYLKKILKGFGKGKKGKFQGSIVLEGCHTAVRVYRDDRAIGGSLLDSLLAIMQNDKFFKTALDDTVTVAGYREALSRPALGASTVMPRSKARSSVATTTRPMRESVHGENDLVTGEDAAVERRWKAKPKYFG